MSKNIVTAVLVSGLILIGGLLWWLLTPKVDTGSAVTGMPMKISSYYWPGQMWKDIANEKGWFGEAGLNVELVDTNADYFASLEAFVAGDMDTNALALFDLLVYVANGADLVSTINTDYSFGAESLVVSAEIKKITDLRGLRIATSKGTYLEYLLSVVLNRSGMSLSDITVVDLPGEQLAKKYIGGSVDAVFAWEPEPRKAMEGRPSHKLFDTSQIPGISPGIEVFHRKFVRERPGDVQAYVNVWHRTTRFIQDNPGEAFAIIARKYNVPVTDVETLAYVDKILGLRDNLTAFSYAASVESLHGSARKINEFMKSAGLTDKNLSSTKIFDARFVRNLQFPQ